MLLDAEEDFAPLPDIVQNINYQQPKQVEISYEPTSGFEELELNPVEKLEISMARVPDLQELDEKTIPLYTQKEYLAHQSPERAIHTNELYKP